ncbi:MAG: CapA family protein [Pseudomonadota bacterium]
MILTGCLASAIEPVHASWTKKAAPDILTFRSPFAGSKAPETAQHITLVLAGDTGYAPHRALPRPNTVTKHGRTLSFADTTRLIEQEINGDINFANMETVVSDRTSLRPRSKAFNFITHPNGAKHLVRAGFNLFSMANNHSFDYGAEGVRESVVHANALLGHGLLAHAGIGRNRQEAAKAPVFTVKQTRFAFGAIGIGASSGGIQRARKARPGQLNLRDSSDVSLLMNNLRQADAQYRILSVHQGPERVIRPSSYEVATIKKTKLKQGDIDLYVGHHAHVTRGVELNGERLIIYGLGNFLHHGTANMAGKGGCRDYSVLMRVHLVADQPGSKPQLAALEALPITATHMQTKRMEPAKAAQRIAVLNGLAAQFDQHSAGRKGVRFDIQSDGRGLYCSPAANGHSNTRNLCAAHRPHMTALNNTYARALATCGRSYRFKRPAPLVMVKNRLKRMKPAQVAALETVSLRGTDRARTGRAKLPAITPRPDFSKMTKAQEKAYWTKVWYQKQARKRARKLARSGG